MAKFLPLRDAVAQNLKDGDTAAFEGFTHLIPTAAAHEAIRQGFRNLTLVRMTPDLKLANAYVMPLGGEGSAEVVAALNRHHRFIRGRIAPELDLKFAPDLRFFVDNTFEEFGKIDALLRSERVQRDLGEDEDDA